jgi:hypothetical protein
MKIGEKYMTNKELAEFIAEFVMISKDTILKHLRKMMYRLLRMMPLSF